MQERGQVPNPDDMATCRQCEQLFDMNESGSEDRCTSCVQSRCEKCGGPFGGKAVIREDLDDVQWEFSCRLTGCRLASQRPCATVACAAPVGSYLSWLRRCVR